MHCLKDSSLHQKLELITWKSERHSDYYCCLSGFESSLGLNLLTNWGFSVQSSFFLCLGFFIHFEDMQVETTGDSKLHLGVNLNIIGSRSLCKLSRVYPFSCPVSAVIGSRPQLSH